MVVGFLIDLRWLADEFPSSLRLSASLVGSGLEVPPDLTAGWLFGFMVEGSAFGDPMFSKSFGLNEGGKFVLEVGAEDVDLPTLAAPLFRLALELRSALAPRAIGAALKDSPRPTLELRPDVLTDHAIALGYLETYKIKMHPPPNGHDVRIISSISIIMT
jgi:hypothetical protein